ARDILLPLLEDFLPLLRVGPNPKRRTKMVQYDPGIGRRLRQLDEVAVLMMIVPGVVAEAEPPQLRHTALEVAIEIKPRRLTRLDKKIILLPFKGASLANSPKQTVGRFLVRLEHLIEPIQIPKIGEGNDARDLRLPLTNTTGTRLLRDKFRFPHRPQMFRPILA